MGHTVLLLDDEPHVLAGLARLLRHESYEIRTAGSADEAAKVLQSVYVDLIVSDECMPGMSGTEFLSTVARDYPEVIGIVLTGHPTLPAALRAINEGNVYQFLTKPCDDVQLALTIRRALDQKELQKKSRELLELARRQSALIEEARLLRRLKDLPRRDRATVIAREGRPGDQEELLDAMEDEIRKGRQVLQQLRGGRREGDLAREAVGSELFDDD